MLSRVWASIISAIILLVLDAGYIYTIKNGYLGMVRKIQGGHSVELNVYAAILSYIFVIGGLILLVLPYAQKMMDTIGGNLSLMNKIYIAVVVGGLFGAIVYGVYNTTNMALFKGFSLQFALFDFVWGTFLYYVATLVYLLLRN